MRKYIAEFCRRGLMASGFGPLVLAVLYLILWHRGVVQALEVTEVCAGIVSLFVLAFVAGGMNVLYQIEHLPLMVAISIHGITLYLCYLATYLINGWLEQGTGPILVFTVIFVVAYLVIWAVIYAVIKQNTEKVNVLLEKKQLGMENSL